MRLRLTLIAAAALIGSFGAAGAINGLWATSDARAHSLEGFKAAFGLPYGGATATQRFQMFASTSIPHNVQLAEKDCDTPAAADKALAGHKGQKHSRHASQLQQMAHLDKAPAAAFGIEAPHAPEAPRPPAAPEAPETAQAPKPPAAPVAMKRLIAQAEEKATRTSQSALVAAAAADAAQVARGSVQIVMKVPVMVIEPQQAALERAYDQAVARLERTQEVAARINEGDLSAFVSRSDGKRFCTSGQTKADCSLLSPADVARIRSDVASQVELAALQVRKIETKLAQTRLTDS